MKSEKGQRANLWPHRLAVVLCCATFPLVWIGGLVTSTDSGMAVPDWPNTYGYNLFLYPWRTWIYGPWDLFIEHGHRLFASAVGFLTILLLISLMRGEPRKWVRVLGVVALVAVLFQGVLGGMRVIQNEVLLAKAHGCFGPAFFALTAVLAAVTSGRWTASGTPQVSRFATRLHVVASMTAVIAYMQLVAGAQLRHIAPGAHYAGFRTTLIFHLIGAGLITLNVTVLASRTWLHHRQEQSLVRTSFLLVGLVLAQITLGCAAYVTNYAWPAWATTSLTADYVIAAKGSAQTHFTTAHVATGSLILAIAVVNALRTMRLVRLPSDSFRVASLATGAAA